MVIENAKVLNLSIELAGVILCAMGILLVAFSKVDRQTRRFFIPFYSVLILLAGSNMAGLLMRGLPGAGWRAALYVSNFTEFLTPTILAYIITSYLLYLIDSQRKYRNLRMILLVLLALDVILLLVSQFTGLYYVIDEANVYHRSAAYPLSYVMTVIVLGIDIAMLLRHKSELTKKERIAFWMYIIVPTSSIALQMIQYGVNFTIFSTIIAGLAMYIFVVIEQTDQYYRQEQENAKLRIDIMLSQIQPHFLYNSLGAIEELCDSDPRAAKEATVKFAQYLRGNMASLSTTSLIPFTTELEHTKAYLDLEKLRFEDALQVRYDISCTAFELPTLTLEPLTENAVRHGVRGKPDGRGTVTVSAREAADHYEITVEDDGPGFDEEANPSDGENHVGISNVRGRIAKMCGGKLQIESAAGKGTTATIILPKKQEG